MTIFLMIMHGCKVRQQKSSCMVSFCWTKARTLQAGSTVLISCVSVTMTWGEESKKIKRYADVRWEWSPASPLI